jgi:ribosome-binding protein aMBF1 (putative translation factor)
MKPAPPAKTAKRSRPTTKKKAPAKRARDLTSVFFGKQLKAAREAAGLSQRDLARLVDIPQPDMPAIERGERDVRLSTANRLARSLGVLLRDLLPKS